MWHHVLGQLSADGNDNTASRECSVISEGCGNSTRELGPADRGMNNYATSAYEAAFGSYATSVPGCAER